MSTIKVDTVTTLDGTGNITLSRPLTGLSGSGASLTALNATELTSGTLPMARLSGTLPALNGSALTALNASQLTSGTLPIARLGNDVIDSQHYVAASIDNEHLADDAVGIAELSATGTASNSTFLRGDNAWAAAGGGLVLQCLHTEFTGFTSATNNTYIDSHITANITPASTSSRIVTIVEFTVSSNSTGNTAVGYRMLRGSTVIHSEGSHGGIKVYGHTTNTRHVQSVTGIHVDSPNSTSQQTYKMQFNSVDSATIYINAWGLGSSSTTPSYITLIELSS